MISNEHTFTNYIPTVLDRQECTKHGVPKGVPCLHIPAKRGYLPAVCNKRAKAAGFNAKINNHSLRIK